jgi:hypothetical protein
MNDKFIYKGETLYSLWSIYDWGFHNMNYSMAREYKLEKGIPDWIRIDIIDKDNYPYCTLTTDPFNNCRALGGSPYAIAFKNYSENEEIWKHVMENLEADIECNMEYLTYYNTGYVEVPVYEIDEDVVNYKVRKRILTEREKQYKRIKTSVQKKIIDDERKVLNNIKKTLM